MEGKRMEGSEAGEMEGILSYWGSYAKAKVLMHVKCNEKYGEF